MEQLDPELKRDVGMIIRSFQVVEDQRHCDPNLPDADCCWSFQPNYGKWQIR